MSGGGNYGGQSTGEKLASHIPGTEANRERKMMNEGDMGTGAGPYGGSDYDRMGGNNTGMAGAPGQGHHHHHQGGMGGIDPAYNSYNAGPGAGGAGYTGAGYSGSGGENYGAGEPGVGQGVGGQGHHGHHGHHMGGNDVQGSTAMGLGGNYSGAGQGENYGGQGQGYHHSQGMGAGGGDAQAGASMGQHAHGHGHGHDAAGGKESLGTKIKAAIPGTEEHKLKKEGLL